jgi:ParB family transcriptional regulator, chromosome partitioning protein
LESVILDEPDQLFHVAQQLRDGRERAAALAALIAELQAQGKAIVEDAGNYADEENLYVSAANRADGEPATEKDANAYVISTDYRGQHNAKPVITGWRNRASPRNTNATTAALRPRKAR